jgi:FAD:protein FMN transferase
MSATAAPPAELRQSFQCFGSDCTIVVSAGPQAEAAMRHARARLLDWHHRFSRFDPDSELTRLNRDPRRSVPISPLLRRILAAGIEAARRTGGLVDPTLVAEIEQAGYTVSLTPAPECGAGAHREAARARPGTPATVPAGPHPEARWRAVEIDRRAGTVTRPPGVQFDSGGIAKGVFADELATLLGGHGMFVVDCGGDLRVGGRAALPRKVHVAAPFGGDTLHTFVLTEGAAATSGIGRRSWIGQDGEPSHHLLDPRTGRPAFTGIVQATALAPTATEAEMLSKAALLSGPDGAAAFLRHGGVLALGDGSCEVLEP